MKYSLIIRNFGACIILTTKVMNKRNIFLTMSLLTCFSFLSINAASPDPDGEPIGIFSPGGVRPRSIELECYYLNGYVYIIGDSSVTSISGTVTRIGDNMQWSDSSTSNTLQIAVPTDAGSYHLTFTLSDGSSYYGDYTLTL